jgi:hypothetical protein
MCLQGVQNHNQPEKRPPTTWGPDGCSELLNALTEESFQLPEGRMGIVERG